MTDKLDMSLDDIIKQNKSKRGRGRGGRDNQRGRGRGVGKSRRGSGSAGVLRGGVSRRSSSGRFSFSQRSGGRDVPDVWQHDKYEGGTSLRRGGLGESQMSGQGKLLVSNLDFGVNDSDIQELFSEFGSLSKAAVHFDRSGRSLGTAEVIYQRRIDAVKAMKQYNNVPLDGRPMSIQLVGTSALGGMTMSNRIQRGGSRQNSSFIRAGGRGRGRSRGGRGGREKRLVPSVEDLDAELDAYNAKMETN